MPTLRFLDSYPNVKEHATLSAGASVDHGVDVKTTGEHVNRAADRGCCVSTCSALIISEIIAVWALAYLPAELATQ